MSDGAVTLVRPLIALGSADAALCVDDACAIPAIPTDVEKVVTSLDEGSTAY
jgi:hypothetical protein